MTRAAIHDPLLEDSRSAIAAIGALNCHRQQ
jgi:hypothetical protein